MSGAGRGITAVACGAAGALAALPAGVLLAVLFGGSRDRIAAYGVDLVPAQTIAVVAIAAVACIAGAVVGWRGAAELGTPAPPGPRGFPADVGRGIGVAFRGFLLGCALSPVGAVLAVVSLNVVEGGSVVSLLTVLLLSPIVVLAAGAVGSFVVLPVALALGGAAGWLLGRRAGTATPPAR